MNTRTCRLKREKSNVYFPKFQEHPQLCLITVFESSTIHVQDFSSLQNIEK